ncbi:MAG TPA: hypothetical protein VEV82_02370 [Actinomycetota bacterium]|nr:hypothetical protein [Actinomycetota bacterium]
MNYIEPRSEIRLFGRMLGGEVEGEDLDQLTCISEDQEKETWIVVFNEGTPPAPNVMREQIDRLGTENIEVVIGSNWIVLTSPKTADEVIAEIGGDLLED